MFLPAQKQQASTKAPITQTEAEAAMRVPAETVPTTQRACEREDSFHQDTSSSHQHDQPPPAGAPAPTKANTGGATHPGHPTSERSKSLDITKVCPACMPCIYNSVGASSMWPHSCFAGVFNK
jgi:hypothetical protein